VSDAHEQLKLTWAIYLRESEKFDEDSVKVSAVRARQALHDMKDLLVIRRREIQEKKNDQ
jgi:hypothetical protein|tara:strand:- start:1128 stop:1307 length:180 start_codon:yes stop_codon:yes gene_type:complete